LGFSMALSSFMPLLVSTGCSALMDMLACL